MTYFLIAFQWPRRPPFCWAQHRRSSKVFGLFSRIVNTVLIRTKKRFMGSFQPFRPFSRLNWMNLTVNYKQLTTELMKSAANLRGPISVEYFVYISVFVSTDKLTENSRQKIENQQKVPVKNWNSTENSRQNWKLKENSRQKVKNNRKFRQKLKIDKKFQSKIENWQKIPVNNWK